MSSKENTFLKLEDGRLVEVLGKLSSITLGERDVLVVMTDLHMSYEQADMLEKRIQHFMGPRPVLVLDSGVKVAVIQRDRLALASDGVAP